MQIIQVCKRLSRCILDVPIFQITIRSDKKVRPVINIHSKIVLSLFYCYFLDWSLHSHKCYCYAALKLFHPGATRTRRDAAWKHIGWSLIGRQGDITGAAGGQRRCFVRHDQKTTDEQQLGRQAAATPVKVATTLGGLQLHSPHLSHFRRQRMSHVLPDKAT